MPTYSELVSKAQALMAEAEHVRKEELSSIIADIKAKMAQHGITLQDLGGPGRKPKGGIAKPKAPAKYKGPNGELWSGGAGRKPDWVKQAMAAGKDIESFRI